MVCDADKLANLFETFSIGRKFDVQEIRFIIRTSLQNYFFYYKLINLLFLSFEKVKSKGVGSWKSEVRS